MRYHHYQVGGSLPADAPTYVTRDADAQLYDALTTGMFGYVASPRQTGKTSLLFQMRRRLQQDGVRCAFIDLTRMSRERLTPESWHYSLIFELWRNLRLVEKVDLDAWWPRIDGLPPVQALHRFMEEVLFVQLRGSPIVIFIDEFDSALDLPFLLYDLIDFIQVCARQWAVSSYYQRLTFALFAVAPPLALTQRTYRSLQPVVRLIELTSFTMSEMQPLAAELAQYFQQPWNVLQAIWSWTNGQPFLTQKLCKLAVESRIEQWSLGEREDRSDRHSIELISQLVSTNVLQNWRIHDASEHFKTIRDRLLRGDDLSERVLLLYQQILEECLIFLDDSPEQSGLRQTGLVQVERGQLKIHNRIYAEIFNLAWVRQQLIHVRSYCS